VPHRAAAVDGPIKKGGEKLMDGINQWLVETNKTNHLLFAIVTVVTMSGLGVIIAAVTEVIFKVLGVKGERIEIHH
jgi:hypothetical protein